MPSLTIDELKQKESQKYTNLDDDSDIESESATLVDSVKTRQQRKPIWPYVLPWMVSTLVFACLALKFYLKTLPLTSNEFSFETGWKNEIGKSQYLASSVLLHRFKVKFGFILILYFSLG